MPLLVAATPLPLQELRRRRAVAISSRQQYRAHQRQKQALQKSGALVLTFAQAGQQGSGIKAVVTPQQRPLTDVAKREKRLQIKLDAKEDAIEAIDLLKDQDEAVSSGSSALSSVPPDSSDTGLRQLVLEDVAVLKGQRRNSKQHYQLKYTATDFLTLPFPSVDSDYCLVPLPQDKVVALDEQEEATVAHARASHQDEDGWEVLEDGEVSDTHSPVQKTFAEVVGGVDVCHRT